MRWFDWRMVRPKAEGGGGRSGVSAQDSVLCWINSRKRRVGKNIVLRNQDRYLKLAVGCGSAGLMYCSSAWHRKMLGVSSFGSRILMTGRAMMTMSRANVLPLREGRMPALICSYSRSPVRFPRCFPHRPRLRCPPAMTPRHRTICRRPPAIAGVAPRCRDAPRSHGCSPPAGATTPPTAAPPFSSDALVCAAREMAHQCRFSAATGTEVRGARHSAFL